MMCGWYQMLMLCCKMCYIIVFYVSIRAFCFTSQHRHDLRHVISNTKTIEYVAKVITISSEERQQTRNSSGWIYRHIVCIHCKINSNLLFCYIVWFTWRRKKKQIQNKTKTIAKCFIFSENQQPKWKRGRSNKTKCKPIRRQYFATM